MNKLVQHPIAGKSDYCITDETSKATVATSKNNYCNTMRYYCNTQIHDNQPARCRPKERRCRRI